MLPIIGIVIVIGLMAKFSPKALVHIAGLLAVEIFLFVLFPNLLVKFAQLVAYFRHIS